MQGARWRNYGRLSHLSLYSSSDRCTRWRPSQSDQKVFELRIVWYRGRMCSGLEFWSYSPAKQPLYKLNLETSVFYFVLQRRSNRRPSWFVFGGCISSFFYRPSALFHTVVSERECTPLNRFYKGRNIHTSNWLLVGWCTAYVAMAASFYTQCLNLSQRFYFICFKTHDAQYG
jgi:hypothetical protein